MKQTKEWIEKRIHTRKNNGKPWVCEDARKKMSISRTGSKNHRFGKPSIMRGKHISEYTRLKISKSLKGRKFSDEHIQKISSALNGHIISGTTRMKISEKNKGNTNWLGRKHTDASKQKIRDSKKGKQLGIENPFFGKHHNEETKNKFREKRLHWTIPSQNTKIEVMLQCKITESCISFRIHEPIFGQPDIFIEPNICVFADGCYWHGCEQCFDRNKFDGYKKARIIKDLVITQWLQNHGYIVIRFWEHEINKDIDSCILKIKKQLDEIPIHARGG